MRSRLLTTVLLSFILFGVARVNADLYDRAPDVQPGTIPEMRTPEYWIARMEHPDEVILPIGESGLRFRRAGVLFEQRVGQYDSTIPE